MFPFIDLGSPTRLLFEWGWLLATVANVVVIALVVLVFWLGTTLRLPGARKDVARVEADNPLARSAEQQESRP